MRDVYRTKSSAMYLHLGLDPGSDDISLGGKLPPQPLVGLLSGNFLLKHLVSEGHQLLHLQERHTHTGLNVTLLDQLFSIKKLSSPL